MKFISPESLNLKRLLGAAIFIFLLSPGLKADDLDSYARTADMNPNDPGAQFNYAVKALQAKDFKDAEKAASKVVTLSPKDAQARQLLGEILGLEGDSEGAQKSLEACVQLDPHNSKAWSLLAKIYSGASDHATLEKAADAFAQAAKGDPQNVRLIVNQGLIFAKLGDSSKATLLFEKADGMPGGEALADRYLCQLYNMSGNQKKAAESCLKASQDPSAGGEVFYYLGFAQNSEGQKEAARQSFLKALDINPDYGPAQDSMGYLEYEAGHLEPALKYFQAAASSGSGDDAEAYFNVAVVLGDLGRWVDAAGIYRKLLKKDPQNKDAQANLDFVVRSGVEAFLNQGKDAYEGGNFDDAAKAWKQVLALDPENSTAKDFLSKVKVQNNQSQSAQAAQQAARSAAASTFKTEDAQVLRDGLKALDEGHLGAAVRLLDFYCRKHPEDGKALQNLYKAKSELGQQVGDLLEQAGRDLAANDKAGAKSLVHRALTLDPGSSRANTMLAQLEGHQDQAQANTEELKKRYFLGVDAYLDGNLPKAIEIWKKILAEDPGNLDARRSLSQAQLELAALEKKK